MKLFFFLCFCSFNASEKDLSYDIQNFNPLVIYSEMDIEFCQAPMDCFYGKIKQEDKICDFIRTCQYRYLKGRNHKETMKLALETKYLIEQKFIMGLLDKFYKCASAISGCEKLDLFVEYRKFEQ